MNNYKLKYIEIIDLAAGDLSITPTHPSKSFLNSDALIGIEKKKISQKNREFIRRTTAQIVQVFDAERVNVFVFFILIFKSGV